MAPACLCYTRPRGSVCRDSGKTKHPAQRRALGGGPGGKAQVGGPIFHRIHFFAMCIVEPCVCLSFSTISKRAVIFNTNLARSEEVA